MDTVGKLTDAFRSLQDFTRRLRTFTWRILRILDTVRGLYGRVSPLAGLNEENFLVDLLELKSADTGESRPVAGQEYTFGGEPDTLSSNTPETADIVEPGNFTGDGLEMNSTVVRAETRQYIRLRVLT